MRVCLWLTEEHDLVWLLLLTSQTESLLMWFVMRCVISSSCESLPSSGRSANDSLMPKNDSPSSCCKPVWVSFFYWTQSNIFWRTIGTWAPLTSIVFFFYYGSQWCQTTAWFQSFLKISSFVFSRRKKLIQVCNNLRVNKWWQNFHFWVEYPFKIPLKCLETLFIQLSIEYSTETGAPPLFLK